MKKFAYALVLPLALTCAPLANGQVVAAGAATAAVAAPHLAASVPAVLTTAVSSGSAHVGQAVLARLASQAKLSDGTRLPAGTQLLGKVTQAIPGSKGGQSSLGMVFDRLRMPGGQERPLGASMIRSLSQPGFNAENDSDTGIETQSAAVGTRSNARANGTINNPGNGGLLGGVSNTVSGVGNTVGNTVNAAGDTVGNTVTNATGALNGLANVLVDSTGTLTAKGRNVNVPAGTRVTLAASADASAR